MGNYLSGSLLSQCGIQLLQLSPQNEINLQCVEVSYILLHDIQESTTDPYAGGWRRGEFDRFELPPKWSPMILQLSISTIPIAEMYIKLTYISDIYQLYNHILYNLKCRQNVKFVKILINHCIYFVL